MKNEECKNAFFEDIALLKEAGAKVIIVHGGGPLISEYLNKLNISSEFINGLRVTDEKVIEIVEMVLSGKINKEICSGLCSKNISSIGISGRDGALLLVDKLFSYIDEKKVDLGYVGQVKSVNKKLLQLMLDENFVSVVSPIGTDEGGNPYNVNADYAAAAISSAVTSNKLVFITDVEGVYENIEDKNSLISSINKEEAKTLIKRGIIKGGMIPKIQCCIDALDNGTKNVQLIDGRKKHSLLLSLTGEMKTSTTITSGGVKNAKNSKM